MNPHPTNPATVQLGGVDRHRHRRCCRPPHPSHRTRRPQIRRPAAGICLLVLICLTVAVGGCASDEQKKARHLERAEAYVSDRNYPEAVIELKNAIQLDPEDDAPYLRLGNVYLRLNQPKLAARAYGDAVDANPDNIEAHYKLGQLFLAAKKPLAARKAAKLIIQRRPADVDAHLLLAGVQVLENNLEAAVRTLQQAISRAPGELKPRLFLAHLLEVNGRLAEAEQVYLEANRIDPAESRVHLALMAIYGQQERWAEVEAVFAKIGPLPPRQHPKLAALARFCEGRRQYALAEKLYRHGAAAVDQNDARPLRDLGAFYARRRRYDEALTAMQQARQRRPADLDIQADIAGLLLDRGQRDAAEKVVNRVLDRNANHARTIFLKGEILFAQGRYAEARNTFDLAITHDPANARAHYYRALCILNRGAGEVAEVDLFRAAAGLQDDVEQWIAKQAADSLHQALKLDPQLLAARLTLAEVHLRQGNAEDARRQIERALDQAPGDLHILALEGSIKLLEGDFQGAEALCRRVLERYPNRSPWQTRLGVVYRMMRRPEAAAAAFRRALELNPQQFEALKLMIDLLIAERDYPAALEACAAHWRAVEQAPTARAFIQNLRGRIYTAWGKPAAARGHFEQAIAEGGEYLAPRLGLAAIEVRQERPEAAIALYESVLAINPDHLPSCMALGGLYHRQGNRDRAMNDYRRALAIRPGHAPAANNLAYLLAADDTKLREALDLAQRAKLQLPRDAAVRDTLGWIYYRTGQYPLAVEELETSLQIDPENALAHYHLGLAYYQVQRFKQSREMIRRALALDPNFEAADEARTMVDDGVSDP